MNSLQLSANQLTTLKQAQDWMKLETPKFIMFGSFPNTKAGREFFKPFLDNGIIDKNHLKFAGAFRLTTKGIDL